MSSETTGVVPMKRVWATVVSQDAYLPGALVLGHCLERVQSKYPLIVLATPSLSQKARTLLTRAGTPYLERPGLYPSLEQHDPRITDDRFEEVWTKLRLVNCVSLIVAHWVIIGLFVQGL
jgi:hypothetical protein